MLIPGSRSGQPARASSWAIVAFVVSALVGLGACSPPTVEDVYPGMKTGEVDVAGGSFRNEYYWFERAPANDTLVVLFDGSGYSSVLGQFNGDHVVRQGLPALLVEELPSEMDLLVPEKPNVAPGQDAEHDPSVLGVYSLANRSAGCVAVVQQVLSQRSYRKVVFLGFSEGGVVAPYALRSMASPGAVTGLILASSGGDSQYEDFKILWADDPEKLADLESAKAAIEANPQSIDDTWEGYPYLRWSGFLEYAPIDDLINEPLPTLLLHGTNDRNVPVESSRAAYQTLVDAGRSDVRYIETADDHDTVTSNLGLIADWIRDTG